MEETCPGCGEAPAECLHWGEYVSYWKTRCGFMEAGMEGAKEWAEEMELERDSMRASFAKALDLIEIAERGIEDWPMAAVRHLLASIADALRDPSLPHPRSER